MVGLVIIPGLQLKSVANVCFGQNESRNPVFDTMGEAGGANGTGLTVESPFSSGMIEEEF